ncbi:hypothetical protein QLL95_gp0837 [Cotonvirus japonicus]|uniref:Uncharacterized protein n=1 Tax=Cotonvirus japonicus TaxID=2811091 RepID=A0ABM7NT43_9VIRU|nr:hypothetical protein QLL95_gp0837 [Cotonvirus japonicus]BCS83286.1 hypothetical protein [Cotonvirus japonicus]
MVNNVICNKYVIIILIIIIVVLLFLFWRKNSSRVEKMDNINIDPEKSSETPWTETNDDSGHKLVNNSFDRYIDEIFIKRNGKNFPTKRKDEQYEVYTGENGKTIMIKSVPDRIKKHNKLPVPLDDRPDLSQCQPCICPQDKYIPDSDSEDSPKNRWGSYSKNKYRRS